VYNVCYYAESVVLKPLHSRSSGKISRTEGSVTLLGLCMNKCLKCPKPQREKADATLEFTGLNCYVVHLLPFRVSLTSRRCSIVQIFGSMRDQTMYTEWLTSHLVRHVGYPTGSLQSTQNGEQTPAPSVQSHSYRKRNANPGFQCMSRPKSVSTVTGYRQSVEQSAD
jgi:hypothetical protein